MTIEIIPTYRPTETHTDSRTHVVSYNLSAVRASEAEKAGDKTLAQFARDFRRKQAEKLMEERRKQAAEAGLQV